MHILIFKGTLKLVVAFLVLFHFSSAFSASEIKFASEIERYKAQHQLPCVAVIIIQDNRIIYKKAHGEMDKEKQVVCHNKSWFRLASVSKVIVGLLASKLVKENKLQLDKPVHKVINHKNIPPDLTLRHLLSNTGGIAHYPGYKKALKNQKPGEVFSQNPKKILDFTNFVAPPGSRYHYSTFGFIYAGWAIEGQLKAKLEDLIKKYIHTAIQVASENKDQLAGYNKQGANIVRKNPGSISWKAAGGGLITNLDGFSVVFKELIQLARDSNFPMFQKVPLANGGWSSDYGLGIHLSGTISQPKYFHNGKQNIARCRIVFYPNKGKGGVGMFVFSNAEHFNPGQLTTHLFKLL